MNSDKSLILRRYRVIERLGSGGFGHTYLVEDTKQEFGDPPDYQCAIKEIKPDLQNDQRVKERFVKETEALKSLVHSQIPRFFHYHDEDNQFYLVQELIEGNTLDRNQGKLSEDSVRDILISLLKVLECVHAKGMIHRDIKPLNIILRSSDNLPVLIDFGCVKDSVKQALSSSEINSVIGTYGYAPREQFIEGKPVFASDLYALGKTVNFLLDIQNINYRFRCILNKATQEYLSDRYQTATEMLEDLQNMEQINDISPAVREIYDAGEVGDCCYVFTYPPLERETFIDSLKKHSENRIINFLQDINQISFEEWDYNQEPISLKHLKQKLDERTKQGVILDCFKARQSLKDKLAFYDDIWLFLQAIYEDYNIHNTSSKPSFVFVDTIEQSRNCTQIIIAWKINFRDSSKPQVTPIIFQGLSEILRTSNTKAVLERIWYWTNGHPFLIQQLLQLVLINSPKQDIQGQEQKYIDSLVEQEIRNFNN